VWLTIILAVMGLIGFITATWKLLVAHLRGQDTSGGWYSSGVPWEED
jgi:hypothetical protein